MKQIAPLIKLPEDSQHLAHSAESRAKRLPSNQHRMRLTTTKACLVSHQSVVFHADEK